MGPTTETSSASTAPSHGSVMLALEHPSGAVRARALEQLARVTSKSDVSGGGVEGTLSNVKSCRIFLPLIAFP